MRRRRGRFARGGSRGAPALARASAVAATLTCAAALAAPPAGAVSADPLPVAQTLPAVPAPTPTTGAPVPTGATPSPTPAAPAQAETQVLYDRRTVSHWAYPASEAPVRDAPAPHARRVGRLRLLTVDAQAELYLALTSRRLADGSTWIQIELPGRPNGRSGWVPAAALGPLHTADGYLRVDRRRLRATLYRRGHVVFSAPVGVGKPGTITPAGSFYVMEKLRAIGSPVYGPFAIGTSAYAPTLSEWPGGGVVGIHGTNEPQLIPGRPSHGCIRMRNGDITRLWRIIALGTPIEID